MWTSWCATSSRTQSRRYDAHTHTLTSTLLPRQPVSRGRGWGGEGGVKRGEGKLAGTRSRGCGLCTSDVGCATRAGEAAEAEGGAAGGGRGGGEHDPHGAHGQGRRRPQHLEDPPPIREPAATRPPCSPACSPPQARAEGTDRTPPAGREGRGRALHTGGDGGGVCSVRSPD